MSADQRFLHDSRSALAAEFAVADKDDDGAISEEEFSKLIKAFRPSSVDSGNAFAQMDQGDDGKITLDEYITTWVHLITTVDPEAVGNVAIGSQLIAR